MTRKAVLVLSGLDPTGGAGLLADVSIMRAEQVYALGIPTALTVQTGRKVIRTRGVSKDYFRDSLQALLETFRVSGVKIGMVPSPGIAREIFSIVRDLPLKYVVWDPVLHSTYGTPLTSDEALDVLKKILPLCTLATPNLLELKQISSLFGIRGSKKEMLGRELSQISGTSILVTGGHGKERGTDYLFHGRCMATFPGKVTQGKDFHGTGCTLSSMILAHLVKGYKLETAVKHAKKKLEKRLLEGFRSIDGRWFMGV